MRSCSRNWVVFIVCFFFPALLQAGGHTSLSEKVYCGYQGWFRAEGDGSNMGWVHYGPGRRLAPGTCSFDLWPDLAEFSAEERYPSPFVFSDGTQADLFSSVHPKTVGRHFRWMREYGIDGAFLQRFATGLRTPSSRESLDVVLRLCTAAANEENRSLIVMYDLSGLEPVDFGIVGEDWERIVAYGQLQQPCAQLHEGRPLVALWGLGFKDRPPAFQEWGELIRRIKATGCSVMIGVPAYWRELKGDSVSDPQLHTLLESVDVISPWTVGRVSKVEDVAGLARAVWGPDKAWCDAAGKSYMPVVFPGFSWHNLSALRGKEAVLNQIPRQGGRLFWRQAVEARNSGARMVYVAMFDEIDEGTAIMKCGGPRPVGKSPFVDLSDVPSDHYLWLTGQMGRLFRGEVEFGPEPPLRQ